jgi:hypothetical protein
MSCGINIWKKLCTLEKCAVGFGNVLHYSGREKTLVPEYGIIF